MNSIAAATSKNIKRARKSLGWRQVDLAKKMGVSEKSVIDWEGAKQDPSNGNLEKMAELMGLPNGRWFFQDPEGDKSEAIVISRDWARRLTDVYRGVAAVNPAAIPLPEALTQMQEVSATCITMPAIAEVVDLADLPATLLEEPESPAEEVLTSIHKSLPPGDLSIIQFLAPI